jgi:hypothetical protein
MGPKCSLPSSLEPTSGPYSLYPYMLLGRQNDVPHWAYSVFREHTTHAMECAGVKHVLSAQRENEPESVKHKCLCELVSQYAL